MAKILSAEEARLQKKLVPVNIFVFIISLVAVLSLFFAPIVKVDVGKILRNENIITYAENTLDKLIDENIDASTEEGFTLDFSPIITAAVVEVLGKAEGTITFSALEVSKYAADKREDKLEILLDGMVYGKNGIVTKLVNSMVEGVTNTFTSDEGKAVVEDALVDSLISSMGSIVDNVGDGENSEVATAIKEKLTDEKVGELKETFLEINNVQSEDDVKTVVDNFVTQLNTTLEKEYITEENKETVKEYIVDIYNQTMDAIEASGDENAQFSLEAMICVAVSSNIDMESIDIGKLLQNYVDQLEGGNSSEPAAPSSKVLAAETDGENTPDSGENTPDNPPSSENKPVLSYSELFAGVGLSSEQIGEISDNLNTIVKKYVDDALASTNESLKQIGPVYNNIYLLLLAVLLVFILPWLIMAITALIRTFTKNKRYMMWYVKLFGFLLALIFVALFVVKTWGPALIFGSMQEETLGIVMAALGGISSFTWISGICYILLWLVSICWAFPIKHKIRKERKACKQVKKDGTYKYENYKDDYGYAVTQDEAPAVAAPTEDYGGGYENYDGYDDAYSDGYGGYDDDYGGDYGGGYDNEDYGFDDDYDVPDDYNDDY